MASPLAQSLSNFRQTMPESGSGLKQGIQNFYAAKQMKGDQALRKKEGELTDIQLQEKKLDVFDKQYGPAIMASVKSPELWAKNQQAKFIPEGMSYEEGQAYTMFKMKKDAMARQAEVQKDVMKEQRQSAKEVTSNVKKDVIELKGTYDTLANLADSAKDPGNKQARAAMITMVARLLSPGIVTENDFRTLTGGANPVQAVLAHVMSKDTDVGAQLASYVDPTGEGFNADQLLGVADDIFKARGGALITAYDDAKNQAIRAEMGDRAFNAIFGDTKAIDEVRSLITPQDQANPAAPTAPQAQPAPQAAPQAQPAQITEGTIIVNPQTNERLILRNGQWQPAP